MLLLRRLLSCPRLSVHLSCLFFFNDTATTEIYTLSLHDALPICSLDSKGTREVMRLLSRFHGRGQTHHRSEEHTSELQSHVNIVCRLLLEKKKKKIYQTKINDTTLYKTTEPITQQHPLHTTHHVS